MADDQIFSATTETREPRNWTPIIIGLVIVVVIVAGLAIIGRERKGPTTKADPYAANLKASGMSLSQADNFVGSTVTYLDFTLTNSGNKTISGAQVEATFKNSLGEVVQKEIIPIRALVPNKLGGYPDLVDLGMSPIAPGKGKIVRIALEHVSNDWDQSAPDLRFINIRISKK